MSIVPQFMTVPFIARFSNVREPQFSSLSSELLKFKFESLALAPIAVRPEFQQKGIGGQLIKSGLNKARELKYKSVIVLGHKHYYPKFGFEPVDKWNIKAPFDVPADFFMGLELVKDGLKGVSGTVRYPKEFDTV